MQGKDATSVRRFESWSPGWVGPLSDFLVFEPMHYSHVSANTHTKTGLQLSASIKIPHNNSIIHDSYLWQNDVANYRGTWVATLQLRVPGVKSLVKRRHPGYKDEGM